MIKNNNFFNPQNYEKALGALSECLKCFERVPSPKVEERAEEIARATQLISRCLRNINTLFFACGNSARVWQF